MEAIGAALGERMTSLPAAREGAFRASELGRWLVGEAGVYLTRVIDRKESRGEDVRWWSMAGCITSWRRQAISARW